MRELWIAIDEALVLTLCGTVGFIVATLVGAGDFLSVWFVVVFGLLGEKLYQRIENRNAAKPRERMR